MPGERTRSIVSPTRGKTESLGREGKWNGSDKRGYVANVTKTKNSSL